MIYRNEEKQTHVINKDDSVWTYSVPLHAHTVFHIMYLYKLLYHLHLKSIRLFCMQLTVTIETANDDNLLSQWTWMNVSTNTLRLVVIRIWTEPGRVYTSLPVSAHCTQLLHPPAWIMQRICCCCESVCAENPPPPTVFVQEGNTNCR